MDVSPIDDLDAAIIKTRLEELIKIVLDIEGRLEALQASVDANL